MLEARRRTALAIALAIALEKVGHQRPLRIGQIGVHAACAVTAAVGVGVANAHRRRTLDGGVLPGATQRLESLNTGLTQSLAHGQGIDLRTRAP